jgi:MoxR-like ATPase
VRPWPIYTGSGVPHDGIDQLPAPPNWRTFDGGPVLSAPPADLDRPDPSTARRLGRRDSRRVPHQHEIQMINAALFLRRPLLITGRPGTGKSTLAYSVAEELKLGRVLRWPITSRSTLQDGLYRYDPIGRLREENLRQLRQRPLPPGPREDPAGPGDHRDASAADDIGRHVRLGPLGTALLPYAKPRVLLIDEIDKSDFDLPNDLLNVFEEGEFEIEELTRLPDETGAVPVMTSDPDAHIDVHRGRVRCRAFPFVVLTSNGEREFPPAFLRRCLRLDLQPPDEDQLTAILAAHLGPQAAAASEEHIRTFLARRDHSEITTDQLLNAAYLAMSGIRYDGEPPGEATGFEDVVAAVMRPLTEIGNE